MSRFKSELRDVFSKLKPVWRPRFGLRLGCRLRVCTGSVHSGARVDMMWFRCLAAPAFCGPLIVTSIRKEEWYLSLTMVGLFFFFFYSAALAVLKLMM